MARKQKVEDLPDYDWGGTGGRTTHPVDPTGEIFGKSHWPKAQPHEKFDWTGKTAGFVKTEPERYTTPGMRVQQAVSEAVAKEKTTTTGLVTLEDFLAEAERAGVLDAVLTTKLHLVWKKELPNEGMRRMQANNLLRNAIKRKAQ